MVEQRIITDTDFISPLPTEGDFYELLYGSLYHIGNQTPHKYEFVYNLTVLLCIKQQVTLLRRVCAKEWKASLKDILKELYKQKKEADSIIVSIPFIDYYETVERTIAVLEFVCDVLDELLSTDFKGLELLKIDYEALGHKFYPIPAMEEFFKQLAEQLYPTLVYQFRYPDARCVTDEAVRRGFLPASDASEDYDKDLYRSEILMIEGDYAKESEGHESVIKESDKEKDVSVSKEDIGTVCAENQIGVLYYMLNGKVDADLLVKVGNFIINKDYNISKRANNSVYKYIHCPTVFLEKLERIEYIKSQLQRYGIPIPKELE